MKRLLVVNDRIGVERTPVSEPREAAAEIVLKISGTRIETRGYRGQDCTSRMIGTMVSTG